MSDCPFCRPCEDRIILRNELAYALLDSSPVTPLHVLVIPIRHMPDYFSLSSAELLACDELLRRAHERCRSQDHSIEGCNIGLNAGAAAGQTIFHCHFHLIPRRAGDMENPRGGVRHVIPERGNY
jgi:diadenosine tetraphosphate (Ap4A) HIT family hydrolase